MDLRVQTNSLLVSVSCGNFQSGNPTFHVVAVYCYTLSLNIGVLLYLTRGQHISNGCEK